ncbi:hypothetical protein ACELLULO517_06685 [Acidisoma cellulosilytica]|uniref:REase AHJR-like domain-containing protein n=1 Tax=Acidisoma cellulosilyticum TaxID=2802395 RepID=A0A964E322_9PROT|nr:hypothetical protein [Acidisoma cellulosilyticum]MCB8879914.1 hypothetical protein [Acidisoma cellulosilyticum]
MTKSPRQRERAVLQAVIPGLEAEGFEVFLQPGAQLLPPFMAGYRPDAIALKPGRKIAIEVTAGGGDRPNRPALQKIQAIFASQRDWEFQILYAPPSSSDPDLAPEPKEAIFATLRRLPSLLDQGGAVAALLTGWSAFEAAARRLMPDDFERPQSPSRMLETLAFSGAVTPDEADLLRDLGRRRNQAAHGKLDVTITPAQLEQLIAVTRVLLELTEPADAV